MARDVSSGPAASQDRRQAAISLMWGLAVAGALAALLAWPHRDGRPQPVAGAGAMLLDEPPAPGPAVRR